MRFMMIARPQMPIPPEVLPQLVYGFGGWWQQYKDKWDAGFFAGGGGGGGICTVADEAEFNRMMMEWPLAPFSDIDAHPLIEVDQALKTWNTVLEKMMAGQGAGQRHGD